jgi:hypothetical protein
MRGSIIYQVQNIFKTSGINKIGESKHIAKENVRKNRHSSITFISG